MILRMAACVVSSYSLMFCVESTYTHTQTGMSL
jgi:hypothetical protein